MPIYESETTTVEDLIELRKKTKCKVCSASTNVYLDNDKNSPNYGLAFLACWDWLRTHHEGIEREASRYEQEGMLALNIESRRNIMEKQFGEEKTKALAKYQGVISLTEEDARKVVTTLWPAAEKASPEEVFKAITICTQYGLNPLMRHLFLIPYWNSDKKRHDYSCILGITSNRLIASRKHHWSFLDDTPRISTEEEEIKHYRKVNPDRLRAIAKIRDIESGAEVTAWGEWPIWKLDKNGKKVPNEPKGLDKGNSMENMVCIHAERKGLDMLYPADMPSPEIPVMDESYIDSTGRIIEEDSAEIVETEAEATEIEPEVQTPEPEREPEPAPEPEPKAEEKAVKTVNPKRDPAKIKSLNDLFKACNEDFKMQPAQVVKEAGYKYKEDISEKPSDIYMKISSAR